MKRLLVLAPALLLLAAPARASDTAFQRHLAKGVFAVDSGDARGGAAEFREALRERPDDPVATLYLGIALSRDGDAEAGPTLEKALAMAPDDPRANLEMGIHYRSRGRPAEADGCFAKTIALAPGSDEAAKAEAYRKAPTESADRKGAGEAAAGKRWLLSLSAGGQYDTNVVLGPRDNPLPPSVARKSDSSLVIHLKGRYGLFSGPKHQSSVGYAFFQTIHRRLHDFDVSQHVLDLRGGYAAAPWLALKGIYAFEYVSLGGDRYDSAHTLSASGTIPEGERFSTVAEYRFRRTAFANADLFPANSDRTGTNNAVGVTQNASLFKRVRARAGYWYDRDSADKAFWCYTGHKGFAGARFDLPYRTAVDLSAEWYRKSYDAPYPGAGGRDRTENTHSWSAQAGVGLAEHLSASAAYAYIDNFSNVALFTYKREITSLLLTGRF